LAKIAEPREAGGELIAEAAKGKVVSKDVSPLAQLDPDPTTGSSSCPTRRGRSAE